MFAKNLTLHAFAAVAVISVHKKVKAANDVLVEQQEDDRDTTKITSDRTDSQMFEVPRFHIFPIICKAHSSIFSINFGCKKLEKVKPPSLFRCFPSH